MINKLFEIFMIRMWNTKKITIEEYQIVVKWMQKFQQEVSP